MIRAGWLFNRFYKALSSKPHFEQQAKIRLLSPSEMAAEFNVLMDRSVIPKIFGGDAEMPPCPNFPGIENIAVEPVVAPKSAKPQ